MCSKQNSMVWVSSSLYLAYISSCMERGNASFDSLVQKGRHTKRSLFYSSNSVLFSTRKTTFSKIGVGGRGGERDSSWYPVHSINSTSTNIQLYVVWNATQLAGGGCFFNKNRMKPKVVLREAETREKMAPAMRNHSESPRTLKSTTEHLSFSRLWTCIQGDIYGAETDLAIFAAGLSVPPKHYSN